MGESGGGGGFEELGDPEIVSTLSSVYTVTTRSIKKFYSVS